MVTYPSTSIRRAVPEWKYSDTCQCPPIDPKKQIIGPTANRISSVRMRKCVRDTTTHGPHVVANAVLKASRTNHLLQIPKRRCQGQHATGRGRAVQGHKWLVRRKRVQRLRKRLGRVQTLIHRPDFGRDQTSLHPIHPRPTTRSGWPILTDHTILWITTIRR